MKNLFNKIKVKDFQSKSEYEYKNEFLHGHKLAPLSIKFYNQNVYSCSSDCHILVHCLEVRKILLLLIFYFISLVKTTLNVNPFKFSVKNKNKSKCWLNK